jgi:hypothetical protein
MLKYNTGTLSINIMFRVSGQLGLLCNHTVAHRGASMRRFELHVLDDKIQVAKFRNLRGSNVTFCVTEVLEERGKNTVARKTNSIWQLCITDLPI